MVRCGLYEGRRVVGLAEEGSFQLFSGRVELIHLQHPHYYY